MSQLDDELSLLKQKITILEEQKRVEAEQKVNPLMILERIIQKKKECPNVMRVAESEGKKPRVFPMSTESFTWTLDQNDKAEFLEPIFNILKSIEERLESLETKAKESSIEERLESLETKVKGPSIEDLF